MCSRPTIRRITEPKHPHEDHRQQVVAPLHAQAGDGVGRQQQHRDDAEVGGVPDVPAADSQDVLRGDRDRRAQRVRPERRRADQDADADARDVGAGEVRPLCRRARGPTTSSTSDRGGDREEGARPALEEAEGDLAGDEHAGDEARREVAMIEAQPARRFRAWPRTRRRWPRSSCRFLDLVHAVGCGLRQLLHLARRPAHDGLLDRRAGARDRSAGGAGSARRIPTRPTLPAPAAGRSRTR